MICNQFIKIKVLCCITEFPQCLPVCSAVSGDVCDSWEHASKFKWSSGFGTDDFGKSAKHVKQTS